MKTLLYKGDLMLNRGLVLLTAYFFFMLLVRAKLTGTIYLFFLIWNVMLAAVPYCLSAFLRRRKIEGLLFWSTFLLWLAFLPNSFYILTDMMHLGKSRPVTFWLDLIILATATFTGFMFGMKSILHMEKMLALRIRWFDASIFEFALALLCGIGIFLGRVLRLNSWDFILRPAALLDSIEDLFLHSSIAFIFSISSFIWLTLTAFRCLNSRKHIKIQ